MNLFCAPDYPPVPGTDPDGTLRGTNALRLAKVVLFTQPGPEVAHLYPFHQRDKASWSIKRFGGGDPGISWIPGVGFYRVYIVQLGCQNAVVETCGVVPLAQRDRESGGCRMTLG